MTSTANDDIYTAFWLFRAQQVSRALSCCTTVNEIHDLADDARWLYTFSQETEPGKWDRFIQNDIFEEHLREALREIVRQ